MADRMNIKFTIQAVDRFSKVMDKLERKLDSVKVKAKDMEINREMNVDADVNDALRNLNALQAQMNRIDRAARKPKKIVLKTEEANRSLERITDTIGGISSNKIDIDADTRGAFTELRRVDDFLTDIRRRNTEIKTSIDMDTGGATRSLNRISDIITGLGDKRLKIEVDNAEAIRSLNDMEGVLSGIRRNNTEIRMSAELDISQIPQTLQRVARMTDSVMNARDNYRLGYDTMPATAALRSLNALADDVVNDEREIDIGVDMAGAIAQMAAFRSAADAITEINADVELRTAGALREMMTFRAIASLPIVVTFNAEIGRMRSQISSVATLSRNAGEAIMFQFSSMALAFSTAIVPVLAVTAANLAHIGVMAGVAGGATLGLVSAFVAAGAGAAGFAAVAIPSLTGVFTRAEEINDLEMKIVDAKALGDIEKANELTAEMDRILKGMTESQVAAHTSLTQFKETYNALVSDMESGVLIAFSTALDIVASILERLRPLIDASVDAVNRLLNAMERNLDAEDVKEFFNFLNTNGASSLGTITKSLGNFLVGILNVMAAFGPLSIDMQGGFLAMSEGFREWTAGLSESTAFQSFVDYVRTNWPKVKEIFGDGILGMVEMLAAFAPSAESFMDNLVEMMNTFRDWAQTLGENQQFQEFLDYVIANGPQVTSFFGSIISTLVSLGEALAPIGEVALKAATAMFDFFTHLNENYPIIAQVVAFIASLVGAIMSLVLPLGLIRTAFGILWPIIKTAVKHFVKIGLTLLRLSGPVGIVIGLVMGLAMAIYQNWGTIGPWIADMWEKVKTVLLVAWMAIKNTVADTLVAIYLNLKEKFETIKATVSAVWETIKTLFVNALVSIAETVTNRFNSIVEFFTGVFTTIRDGWNHFWNGMWELVVQSTQLIVGGITAAFLGIAEFLIGWWNGVKQRFAEGWESIKSNTNAAKDAIVAAWNRLKELVTNAVTTLKTNVVNAWNTLKSNLSAAMSSIKSAITNAWNTIKSTVSNTVNALKSAVTNAWNTIKSSVTSIVNSVKSAVTTAWNTMKSNVTTAVNNTKSAVSNAWNNIKSSVSSIVSNILSTIRSKFDSIVNSVKVKMMTAKARVTEAWNEVMAFLRGIDLAQIGRDIINGLIGGIKSMAGNLVDAAKGVVDGAINGAKALLGIKSPSRVFRSIGEYTMMGMQVGINNEATRTVSAVTRVADEMTKAFNPQLDASMQVAGGGRIPNAYNNANGTTTLTPSAISRESRSTIEVPVYLEGREIARASTRDVTEIQRRKQEIRDKFNGGVR